MLPGWLDIQVNDIAWLARGAVSADEHAERVREVARYQTDRGVTGFVLATLAAPLEDVMEYLEGIRQVRVEAETTPTSDAAACLGALVEGTFMNPAFHGAHNPAYVYPPNPELLRPLLQSDAVRLLNVAPEMSDEALEVIREATRHEIVVGVGHAKPSAERVREAVEAGLRYVIHLGNGPTGSSLKTFGGGGLLEEALANDALVATVIVDGYHIDPRLVRDYLKRKGAERFVAVSDAGFAMGPPEGEFEVLGIRGQVVGDGEYLQVAPSPDATPPNPYASDSAPLFGSAADMRRIFETLVNLLTVEWAGVYHRHHEAMPLVAALGLASRLCSENPAALLGEADRGRLDVGARADAVLVHVDGEPGGHGVEVVKTWLAGRAV